MNKRAANLDGRTGGGSVVAPCRPTIIGVLTDKATKIMHLRYQLQNLHRDNQ